MVSTNIGEIPEEDFLEIQAIQHGFDSYEDMVRQGFSVHGFDEITNEIKTRLAKQ